MSSRTLLMSAGSGATDYWLATLGGSDYDRAYGIAVDSLGNAYITGEARSDGAGSYDALITKYDSSGTIQWQRVMGGASSDSGNGIAVDSSGNVYIVGYTNAQGAGNYDVLIAKYNTSGAIQWQRTFGGTNGDYGYGIAVDSSGNVYIVGYTDSQGAGNADVIVAKYNTSGTIQWQRVLGGASSDYGQGIAVDSSGNVYITGGTFSQGAGNNDVLIAKYNTSGTIQWQRVMGGANSDYGNGIAVDSSGNVYITGYTQSQGAGSTDALIAKYNTSGTLQWQRVLGGTNGDYGYSIAVDSSGNVYISGTTYSQGAGGTDALIAKYDTSGTIQWQRTLGGASSEQGYGIAVDSSGNVYITGYTDAHGAGLDDVLIAKLPGDGSLTGAYGNFVYEPCDLTDAVSTLTDAAATLTDAAATLTSSTSTLTDAAATLTSVTIPIPVAYWIATLGGTQVDYAYGIAVDSSGNVYTVVSTESQGAGGGDVLIAKYDTSGTIQWQKVLGGTGWDYGYAIAVDSSANVYITGRTESQGAGNGDALIAKYNTSGTIQWQRVLGGGGSDDGYGIAVDSSGNVYITGNTGSQGAGGNDVLIAKYNTSGTIQWQRVLGGAGGDYGYAIAVDSSGNVYITGNTTSQGAGSNDVLITKYNTSGTIQWQRVLGGASPDFGQGIAVDSSGNVYITGAINSQGAGGYDALIAKYDTSGTIQWQRVLGGASGDGGNGIAVDSSGNVYITGGAGGGDALIAKYNTSGTIQWQRTLGGAGNDNSGGIAVDGSGNIYVGGWSGNDDALIAKLPGSGRLTGVYGDFTYAQSYLTAATSTLTDAAATLTDAASTLTDATATLTSSTSTLTSATTTIQAVPYWIATLGGTSNEYGYGIAVDSSGNVYITGFTASQGAGSGDALIAKYDTSGVLQWQRVLGGASGESSSGIAVDSSGNVYIVGYTTSQGAGSDDVLIAKYDTSGTIQWQRTLGGANDEYGGGIAVDSSGNVYITGYTDSQGAGTYDVLIAKYNTSGTIQWQRTLGGASSELSYGIAVDSSGNVYIVGQTLSQGAGAQDALIAKYNTSGTIQWQRVLGGTNAETDDAIAVDSSGNVYITGYTGSQGAGDGDAFIAKYNTSGTIQWQRVLGGTGYDGGRGIAVDSSGNVYITGRTVSQGAGAQDALIAKYNTSGTIQWQRTLGGTSSDYGYAIAVDSSGNIYIGGHTNSSGAGVDDVLIAKLPNDGSLTGNYGPFTYQASTLTAATSTLTDAAATLTDATATLTSSTSTLTDAAATLTSDTITIQTGGA